MNEGPPKNCQGRPSSTLCDTGLLLVVFVAPMQIFKDICVESFNADLCVLCRAEEEPQGPGQHCLINEDIGGRLRRLSSTGPPVVIYESFRSCVNPSCVDSVNKGGYHSSRQSPYPAPGMSWS